MQFKKHTYVLMISLILLLLITACTYAYADMFSNPSILPFVHGSVKSDSSEYISDKDLDYNSSKADDTTVTTEPCATVPSTKSYKKPETTEKITSTESSSKSDTSTSKSTKSDTSLSTGFITTESTTKAHYSKPSVPSEFTCFDDCAFIGNSRLLAIGNYNLAKNVYAVVGLNVDTVYTKRCEGSSVPVIDELNGKDFKKVVIMFGDNECGWANINTFAEHYKRVISSVRERIPDCEIYLVSVLPISESKSAKNEYGYNINSIENVNVVIRDVAESTDCTYIDAGSSLKNSAGYLPNEASSDGCHLNKEYSKIWLNVVAEKISVPETTETAESTTRIFKRLFE